MGRILVNGQRTLPHSIMVNRRGRRFTNEAANYNAFGGAFHVEDVSRFEYANLPCWLVFDQKYVDTYGFRVASGAGGGERARRGCRAATRRPSWPASSASTARSSSARSSGGTRSAPRATTPTSAAATAPSTAGGATRTARARRDATLGPLERGPYYAFEIHSGALGTKGGPRVDPRRPGARPRRRADPRPVRRRQRHGLAVRHDLRRPGRHARPGDGVRLPRRQARESHR